MPSIIDVILATLTNLPLSPLDFVVFTLLGATTVIATIIGFFLTAIIKQPINRPLPPRASIDFAQSSPYNASNRAAKPRSKPTEFLMQIGWLCADVALIGCILVGFATPVLTLPAIMPPPNDFVGFAAVPTSLYYVLAIALHVLLTGVAFYLWFDIIRHRQLRLSYDADKLSFPAEVGLTIIDSLVGFVLPVVAWHFAGWPTEVMMLADIILVVLVAQNIEILARKRLKRWHR